MPGARNLRVLSRSRLPPLRCETEGDSQVLGAHHRRHFLRSRQQTVPSAALKRASSRCRILQLRNVRAWPRLTRKPCWTATAMSLKSSLPTTAPRQDCPSLRTSPSQNSHSTMDSLDEFFCKLWFRL